MNQNRAINILQGFSSPEEKQMLVLNKTKGTPLLILTEKRKAVGVLP